MSVDKTSLTLGWLVGKQIAGMRNTKTGESAMTYNWSDFGAESTQFGNYALGELPLVFSGSDSHPDYDISTTGSYVYLLPGGNLVNIPAGSEIEFEFYIPNAAYSVPSYVSLNGDIETVVLIGRKTDYSYIRERAAFYHHPGSNSVSFENKNYTNTYAVFDSDLICEPIHDENGIVIGIYGRGTTIADIDYLRISTSVDVDPNITAGDSWTAEWEFANPNPFVLKVYEE